MTFRYYLTDLVENTVKGTHSEKLAKEAAEFEDYIVIDALHGKWLRPNKVSKDVQKIETLV